MHFCEADDTSHGPGVLNIYIIKLLDQDLTKLGKQRILLVRSSCAELKNIMGMIVKVGEAKTRLSELLARVEAGEEIVIARGDHAVARLLPMPRQNDVRGAIADILAARSSVSPTSTTEILAWRDEGRR